MAVPSPTPFTIAPTFNPMSGTGSDVHDYDYSANFGDVIFGPSASAGGDITGIMQKVAIGVLVAVGAQILLKKVL